MKPGQLQLQLQGLGLDGNVKRPAISREVRVLGLTGNVKATVLATSDTRAASVASALRELKAAARRCSEGDAYRMLALQLNGADHEAGPAKLRQAVERELGARAASTQIIIGEPLASAQRTVVPAAVVVS